MARSEGTDIERAIPAPGWLAACPERLRPVVEGCAAGTLPPNVALLRLAIEAEGPEEVEAALAGALTKARGGAAERIGAALALWRTNPQAFGTVKATLQGVAHEDAAADPALWARTFDRLAEVAPEGGVALYALGNPDLLRETTEEVVARMAGWGLLGPKARVLEIGCGIGRFVAALAPRVAEVTGLDVSAGMVARARERCGGLGNVRLAVSSGRDLSGVEDGSLDLVLAADVFPYLVQAGVAVRHVEEAARVLAPGGHLLVLNYSYRGDLGRDREEVAALAARHGLEVRRMGEGDFGLWDAATFLLGKA
ncbi:Transcriptional regulator, ArsR family / Methyltransferase fusion [Rubellimicrobium mesophilum DSM 19309]|uniref:Transcriptional regulator, ArsR family / Methyltransferase fusion n=1 Tax=Rubellimicrobium mesophilum DSM 19309 TaxID=442562 RepID=A0A017HRH0_9RHOB|nr:class I SAM-dependent methyltransferase [Rubellimicrobium mesophilum]EYD76966.1 Transcriptional regulator, ArsR family / Methyltransferase fusion [Rubellimicrobium mesophilum DSM 19309]